MQSERISFGAKILEKEELNHIFPQMDKLMDEIAHIQASIPQIRGIDEEDAENNNTFAILGGRGSGKSCILQSGNKQPRKCPKGGIGVAVNPTSNVVIGKMESLLEHQAYVLNPIQKGEKPTALVNINSDDPLVFNTDISNEIAYLYYGLQNSHISKQECMKWIDELRQNGIDTSFVEDVDCKAYYEQLEVVLEQLK